MKKGKYIYQFIIILSFFSAITLGYFSEMEIHQLGISEGNIILPDRSMSFIQCFTKIFFTNTMLGVIIILLMGFITGGLLGIFVIFLNGFILGRILMEFASIELIDMKTKALSVLHIPIEIYAFFLFSFYSHNGFYLIQRMLRDNQVSFEYFPKIRKLLWPLFLLFIAAIIESLVIYFIIL